MGEKCQRCEKVGEDRRTLWMACFYQMNELGLPFEEIKMTGTGDGHELYDYPFYRLRVCKQCRADWLATIKHWFENIPEKPPSLGSGIYVRRLGATVEISEEEWYRENPAREPVRVVNE